jgi:hypothetical protein
LYLFEKFEVGVIHLDAGRNVVAMNDFARKVLPVGKKHQARPSLPAQREEPRRRIQREVRMRPSSTVGTTTWGSAFGGHAADAFERDRPGVRRLP